MDPLQEERPNVGLDDSAHAALAPGKVDVDLNASRITDTDPSHRTDQDPSNLGAEDDVEDDEDPSHKTEGEGSKHGGSRRGRRETGSSRRKKKRDREAVNRILTAMATHIEVRSDVGIGLLGLPQAPMGVNVGGSLHGGSVHGGSVHSGSIHGGSVHGGSIHGGGASMHGGGASMHGGDRSMHGGGGSVHGGGGGSIHNGAFFLGGGTGPLAAQSLLHAHGHGSSHGQGFGAATAAALAASNRSGSGTPQLSLPHGHAPHLSPLSGPARSAADLYAHLGSSGDFGFPEFNAALSAAAPPQYPMTALQQHLFQQQAQLAQAQLAQAQAQQAQSLSQVLSLQAAQAQASLQAASAYQAALAGSSFGLPPSTLGLERPRQVAQGLYSSAFGTGGGVNMGQGLDPATAALLHPVPRQPGSGTWGLGP